MGDICPRTDGACAVIFAAEEVATEITPDPAWVVATNSRHNFTYLNDLNHGELQTLASASKAAYKKAGIKEPLKAFDVAELYLPYSFAGLKWIEELGFCKRGEGPKLVSEGVTDMGGELPVNPSGGVLSSNPIGATGLLRIAEAAMQVMGKADQRQVPDVETALATGFGGCGWSDVMILDRTKPTGG
jgi:acetyl-CoA C-acetyltransferase